MALLLIIAILNLISYASVNDWKSSMILLLAGFITYTTQNEIVLFVGILAAALFRTVLTEGLENAKPESKPKKKLEPKVPEPVMTDSYLEGLTQLTQQSASLAEQQGGLIDMASKLGPMMKQAEKMMQNLPEGFLDAALEKFKTKKK